MSEVALVCKENTTISYVHVLTDFQRVDMPYEYIHILVRSSAYRLFNAAAKKGRHAIRLHTHTSPLNSYRQVHNVRECTYIAYDEISRTYVIYIHACMYAWIRVIQSMHAKII